MTDLAATVGQALVARVTVLNLWSGALLAAALVLDRVLARRTSASWRMALYAPVALRVLLPVDWSLGVVSSSRVDALLAPILHVGGRAEVAAGVGSPSWLYACAAVAYVLVACGLAVRCVRARMRLRRALASAKPLRELPAGAPCPVLEHEELGPMIVGLSSPRIVLPSRLLAPGAEHALSCVMRHEAAHLRRGDAWSSLFLEVLGVVAWPVIPVWVATAQVRQLIELACDEAALRNADAGERRRYGHALLDMAGWGSLTVTALGAGELGFGSTLRARIEALASRRPWPRVAQAIVLSITPLALFAACSSTAAGGAVAGPADDKDYGYAFERESPRNHEAPPAPSGSTPAAAAGRLPPEVIQSVVHASFGAFRACYEAGLKRNPRLTGTVTVNYVIGEDGSTREAKDDGSTLPDQEVVACVVGGFRKLTYPPTQGGVVTVVYPVELSPDD